MKPDTPAAKSELLVLPPVERIVLAYIQPAAPIANIHPIKKFPAIMVIV